MMNTMRREDYWFAHSPNAPYGAFVHSTIFTSREEAQRYCDQPEMKTTTALSMGYEVFPIPYGEVTQPEINHAFIVIEDIVRKDNHGILPPSVQAFVDFWTNHKVPIQDPIVLAVYAVHDHKISVNEAIEEIRRHYEPILQPALAG